MGCNVDMWTTRVIITFVKGKNWTTLVSSGVKLNHFDYFKGKIVPVVSLGCSVAQGGYLKGKIESLPYFFARNFPKQ